MKFAEATSQVCELLQQKKFAINLRKLAVDGKLIRDSDKKIVRITSLTDAQLNAGYVIYSKRNGVRLLTSKAVRWSRVQERLDGKFVMKWHEDLNGTPGSYKVVDYADGWFDA